MQAAWCRLPDTGMYAQVFLRERHPATGWDSVVQVSAAAVSHDQVSVATAPNGDLAVVWVGKDFGNDYNQVCCRRRIAGAWQSVELVSDIPVGLTQYSPCATIDRKGAVHVVWYGRSLMNTYQQVFHRERDSTGWYGIDSVSGERAYQQQYPSVACDAAGRCHAVWCSQTSGMHNQLTYAQRDTDGVWSSPTILTSIDSGSVNYPSIVCDGDTGVHVVWYDDHTGNQDLYYLRGVTPAGVAEPRLSSFASCRFPTALLVRGVLFLAGSPSASSSPSDLVDASGRKVMKLQPGANDVRALAPGVYFVREAQAQAVRKVVITRLGYRE
jgi:hypothetical protein